MPRNPCCQLSPLSAASAKQLAGLALWGAFCLLCQRGLPLLASDLSWTLARWGILLFLLTPGAHGQTIIGELVLGKREPEPLLLEYITADDGLATVAYRSITSTRTISLNKYDQDLKREWSVDLYEQSSGEELTQLAVLDTLIWVFTRSERGRFVDIWAYLITIEGRIVWQRAKILEVAIPGDTRYALTYAPNRKWACLSIALKRAADSLDQIAYYLIGPDTSVGGIWTLPYRERDLEIRRPLQPGNDGTLYALGTHREAQRPYPSYILLRYIPPEDLTLQVPLEIEDLYLVEPTFRVDRDGTVRIAAFYSQRKAPQVQGLVFAEVRGPGFFLAFTRKTPLPAEILQRYLSERQIARGRGIPDLYLDHLIPRYDGGAILIGEQFYITTVSFRNFYGFWYTQDVYHYDDVLLFSVDSTGNLEWVRVLPKSQSGASEQELSYGLLVGEERLYILYRSHMRGTGSQVYVVTINQNGEISSPRPLLSNFRSSDVFYRRFTRQLNNREGIMAYYRQRTGQFVLIRLEL